MKQESIQKILEAFVSLFTQPIEQQDLPTSIKSCTASIVLSLVFGIGLTLHREHSVAEIAGITLVIVLAWMCITAIIYRHENKKLMLARNLSLVSFWIAATFVFVLFNGIIFSSPLDQTIVFVGTLILISILVPFHLYKILSGRHYFLMTLAVWFTMNLLSWHIIY